MNLEKVNVGGNTYEICDARSREMISDVYDPGRQYKAGECCIWENILKKANKNTTGIFDATAWDDKNLEEL